MDFAKMMQAMQDQARKVAEQQARMPQLPPEAKKWNIIYPVYLVNRTTAQGRRVPQDKALAHVTLKEIAEACMKLGYPHHGIGLEDKAYSRDWMLRGRVRVRMYNEDGSPVVADIPSKKVLLLRIAELIPTMPREELPAHVQKRLTQQEKEPAKKKK
eukprot:m51a1_g3751 putative signal recognition particle 19 kda (157) ;mRNA; r:76043-76597